MYYNLNLQTRCNLANLKRIREHLEARKVNQNIIICERCENETATWILYCNRWTDDWYICSECYEKIKYDLEENYHVVEGVR
jgi:hypothetical protein